MESLGKNQGVWIATKEVKVPIFQKELEFLGHLISQDGIKPTQS